jgi:hypothetical protein
MNVFANTWRQLVRRRLWPVAVLLLAGLVAVPFVLAKDPEPVVTPPPPPPEETTAAEEAATGDPLVALAEEGDDARRRRVLGARKDPFAPAPPKKAKKSQADQPEPPVEVPPLPVPADEPPAPPSGGAPADPGFELPPLEEPAAPPKKTYPPDSLIVRFGDATSGSLVRQTVEKLQPLPGDSGDAESQPVLVYTGLTKDGKSAIFMVDAAAEATGDGECKPHPSNCETIQLRKGETEFFDIKDETGNVIAQFQLDLVDINTRKRPAATRARKSVARVTRHESGL